MLPLFAIAVIALLDMTALGVDVGFWRSQQRAQQSAADSAAVSGVIEKSSYSGTMATVLNAAQSEASRNNFTDDSGATTTVTVNQTAATVTGAYAGNPHAVEVIIAKKASVFFAPVLGFLPPTVMTRAVAVYTDPSPYCVIGLNKTAVSVSISSTNIDIPTCGLASNGSFNASGSNVNAKSIDYTLASSTSGSNITINGSSGASPTIFGGVKDPCPSVTACAYLEVVPIIGDIRLAA